ncbi:MAG: hypothetical protein V4675_20170 [Verrucomicrobiota bacterium]
MIQNKQNKPRHDNHYQPPCFDDLPQLQPQPCDRRAPSLVVVHALIVRPTSQPMPNCDFYSTGSDHAAILTHLLAEGDCEIYELSSRPGLETVQFTSISDFLTCYSFDAWDDLRVTIHLQLYPRGARGRVIQRRTELRNVSDPTKAFRFSTSGWGLIQLYMEAPRHGRLEASHTNHNSEKRATTWSDTYQDMGAPDEWDWAVVTSFSRRLNSFIRKLSVAKMGPRVILPAAERFKQSGNQLWPS